MKDVEFLKIKLSDKERETIRSNFVEHKKFINKNIAIARKKSKGTYCKYCEKETSSYCNSHSLPAFCLRNISSKGLVLSINQLVDFPLMDFEKGVNKAGTFHLICRECDSKIFQEYENPEAYINKPTTKMLAQIAMKNCLRYIGKRLEEKSIFELIGDQNKNVIDFVGSMHEVQSLDLDEYEKEFNKAKKISKKNFGDEYYLFFHEKLDYVVPIAFQSSIALVVDLDNNIINDIYCNDPNYKIYGLHVCIFPLEDSSIIMLFIDSKHQKRYRSFYKKFNRLSLDDKLSIINYIVFLYSEDVFLSKEIPKDILENENLISTAQTTLMAVNFSFSKSTTEAAKETYNLNNHKIIPNLLSEKNKLK